MKRTYTSWKYPQYIYLTKDLYKDYTKDSYKPISQFKKGQNTQSLHKKGHTKGQTEPEWVLNIISYPGKCELKLIKTPLYNH